MKWDYRITYADADSYSQVGEPGPVGSPGEDFWKKKVALVWCFVEDIGFGFENKSTMEWGLSDVGGGTAGRKVWGRKYIIAFCY